MPDSNKSNIEPPDRSVELEGPTPGGALTNVEFWIKEQIASPCFYDASSMPKWYPSLSRYLPKSPDTTFLEVGVVPGQVLLFVAQRLHYRCTGLDFSPQIRHLPSFFASLGVEARFVEADFFKWANDQLFTIVYSNGFIEHFTDYEMVVRKHWEKVAPGGLMTLAVPTFKTPVQWWIRQVLYEPWFLQEVLASHNLAIMSLDALRRCVVKVCPGARILRAIREPGVPLWVYPTMKGIRKGLGRKLLWLLIKVSDRILCTFGISCKWCAGVAVILVKKPEA